MKYLSYSIIGALMGLIVGALFGMLFDSFYTKKSQREIKSNVQAVMFGGVGLLAGITVGFKIADEKETKKQKKVVYIKSLVLQDCNYCKNTFTYSTLEYSKKSYCESCISNLITWTRLIKLMTFCRILKN